MIKRIWLPVLWGSLLVLANCGGGGGSGSTSSGTIRVSLTDSPAEEYKAVYVTIREVQVHLGGENWKVIAAPGKTYNLLRLVNGVREDLALSSLESGHYTQMRLILGSVPDGGLNILSRLHPYANYLIDGDDQTRELKIPSGLQTGIKIVRGFDIQGSQTTELILDFDVAKSIVRAGSSGNWLLQPTIKILDTRECAIVYGDVASGGAAIQGALISAQVYSPGAADPKDRVRIETSTMTDESGSYRLFLPPGSYHLVSTKVPYEPAWTEITAASGAVQQENLSHHLASATGILAGSINLSGGSDERYVTFSVRQTAGGEQIEVASLNLADGTDYEIQLPAGNYLAVASTYGESTTEAAVSIPAGGTAILNLSF